MNKTQDKRMKKGSTKTLRLNENKRITMVFIFFIVLFFILCISFFVTQIWNGKTVREKAVAQQLLKQKIGAKRGNILDRNGEVLAQSVDVDTVTVNPKLLKNYKNQDIDKNELATKMAEIFGLDQKEVLDKITSDSQVVTIAKKVDKEKVQQLEEVEKQMKIAAGINIDKDIKRVYPYGKVASNIIGFCGQDGQGLEGIERQLNSVLMGKDGQIITHSDVYRNETKEKPEQLINAEDGRNIYLTIDVNLQSKLEKYVSEAVNEHKAKQGVGIIMNPKNGQILAMVNSPTYDSNIPYQPVDIPKEQWDKMSDDEKFIYRNEIYKNKAVTDTYEPGSIFKIITSAMALEEGKVTPDKKDDFLCTGEFKVADRDIKCWRWKKPHGQESLRDALANSCNPAYIQLGLRIGVPTFYKYLNAFGLFTKTGVDLSGESDSIFHKEEKVGPVEFATATFGQRFNVTPIQMINAVSASVNGGDLLVPKVIYKIENKETGTRQDVKKEEIRKVISKETSDSIKSMLRSVVTNGTAKSADIPGFPIGAKTGTSEPVNPDEKSRLGYTASFLAIAPSDDPEYVVLVIIKHPTDGQFEGSVVAAPAVVQMLKDIYVNYSAKTSKDNTQTAVPENFAIIKDVVGMKVSEAQALLEKEGFVLDTRGFDGESIITNQTPKPATVLEKGSKIFIHTKENSAQTTVEVPNIKNQKYENAKAILQRNNLNIQLDGDKDNGICIIQDPVPGTIMEKGSVVKAVIREKSIGAH